MNTSNNKRYIGSSINITHRLWEHKSKLKKHKHTNKHLQSAWDKYGENSFVFRQILECQEDDLLMYEQLITDGYKANIKEFGYNKRPVSGSNKGLVTSRNSFKAGDKFYRLTLIERAYQRDHNWWWLCECVCGTQKVLNPCRIRSGKVKSCGCLHTENQIAWLREQHKKGPWNKGLKKVGAS